MAGGFVERFPALNSGQHGRRLSPHSWRFAVPGAGSVGLAFAVFDLACFFLGHFVLPRFGMSLCRPLRGTLPSCTGCVVGGVSWSVMVRSWHDFIRAGGFCFHGQATYWQNRDCGS